MKRLLKALIAAALLLPTLAFATPVSWDHATSTNTLEPLKSMRTSTVKVPSLTATSTATSTFAGGLDLVILDVSGKLFDRLGSAGTNGMVLQTNGSGVAWVATSTLGISGGSGTVTSVALTVPTGLTVSGSPVTTSGTLAVALDTGYVIPLSASTTEWANAYASTTALSATSPLSYNGQTGAFSIANAAADGSTKGAASFTANDFDASSGNISLDYANGQAASASAKGFLTSADWTTFNSKVSSTSLSGASVISYTSGTGVITTTGGTFGAGNYVFPTDLTVTGVATSTTFVASGAGTASAPSFVVGGNAGIYLPGSNILGLAAGGAGVSWNGTDFRPNTDNARNLGTQSLRWLSFHSINASTTNATSTNFFATVASSTNAFTSNLTATIGTFLTSLTIPFGTNPTVDATGEMALDTTANQFLVATSTAAEAVYPTVFYSHFAYASSTWTGTTTIPFGGGHLADITMHKLSCYTNVGTANISATDGTDRTNTLALTTSTSTQAFTTNNVFLAGEAPRFEIGTPASSVQRVGCTLQYVYNRK